MSGNEARMHRISSMGMVYAGDGAKCARELEVNRECACHMLDA